MLVTGKKECQISIENEEAIDALLENFGIQKDLNYSVRTIDGVEGIYFSYNTAYHGSPDIEYALVHKGETAIKIFEALMLLKELYDEYLNDSAKLKHEK